MIVASSDTRCNMDGCKTGSEQHWILSQSVASSSRDVSSQSTHCGTQAEPEVPAAVGIAAISPAGEVASLARVCSHLALKESGGGAPQMTLWVLGRSEGFD